MPTEISLANGFVFFPFLLQMITMMHTKFKLNWTYSPTGNSYLNLTPPVNYALNICRITVLNK